MERSGADPNSLNFKLNPFTTERVGYFYYRALAVTSSEESYDLVSSVGIQVGIEWLMYIVPARSTLYKGWKGKQINISKGIPSLNPKRVPFKPYKEMTEAEIESFNHAISRHGHEFGLKWGKKETLPKLVEDFNTVTINIRNKGNFMGIEKVQFGVRGSGKSAEIVDAYVYNLSDNGKIYYYWETLDGKFISVGLKTR